MRAAILLCIFLAGCVQQAALPDLPPPAPEPLPEVQPLRLWGNWDGNGFTNQTHVLRLAAPRGPGGGGAPCAGSCFEEEIIWKEGRIQAENGTTGTIRIAAKVTPASPLTVYATILLDGVAVVNVTGSTDLYSNPFLAGAQVVAPSDSIVMPFTLDAVPGPVNVTLSYRTESVGVINGYHYDNNWDRATGIEFDAVRVYRTASHPDPDRG